MHFRAAAKGVAGAAVAFGICSGTATAFADAPARQKAAVVEEKRTATYAYPVGSHCYPPVHKKKHWVSNWDGMAVPEDASDDLKQRLKKAPVRNIILVRHGQYDLDSVEDPPLTALGREQARILGERIKKWTEEEFKPNPKATPRKTVVTSLTSSTVKRAMETCDIIGGVLGRDVDARDPLLDEGVPCPVDGWDPLPSEAFQDSARIEAAFRKYCHRSVDGCAAHRKEEKLQKKSPGAALPTYDAPPTCEIIVCHGNVIRYFVTRGLQLPPSAWLRLATYNTGITRLNIGPTGNVSMTAFGDIGHLKQTEVTYH